MAHLLTAVSISACVQSKLTILIATMELDRRGTDRYCSAFLSNESID